MITKTINPDIYEIEVTVQEVIYGNTVVDKYTGWDQIESTTLKLRCGDCTVMVYKKDIELFKNVSSGFKFKAIVKEWKENIYNFKKLVS
ncbi:hypothetical protein [Xanthomarina gelatinilytica]|uniref:hypothetical protein n=1 Tax=Xanthomarina gelatinilytica TaxID=1137281 RepID=UPI003AA7C4F6